MFIIGDRGCLFCQNRLDESKIFSTVLVPFFLVMLSFLCKAFMEKMQGSAHPFRRDLARCRGLDARRKCDG